MASDTSSHGDTTQTNPLLEPWTTPFEAPPFDRVAPEHMRPAFDRAIEEDRDEVTAIAADPAPPSFENTIAALERSGRSLSRVASVFFHLSGTDTNDALQAIEREIAPVLARHRNAILLDENLFRRVDDLYARRDALGLDAEQSRVLERVHRMFTRAGAALPPDAKARLAAITERLAVLGTKFGQNVLADEMAYALVLDGEADLAGLPAFVREAAARAARERGLHGKHVITLARSSIEPFLQFSARRDLREQAFKAWGERGDRSGEADNKAVIAEMVRLRAEMARLLGYATYAHYRLDDTMAGSPEAALELIDHVWRPARTSAMSDRDALQALVSAEGGNFALAPWDWRHYAEKRRKIEHDIDEAAIKPFLQLDRMIEAAFDTATRLFGLTFAERHDIPLPRPDVRVWEVRGGDGRHVGLFYGDYFARPSKRSGAWASALRRQQKLTEPNAPIIVNVLNFSQGAEGEPALLSLDDARTLFHEFGHALHGLLSDVTYPMISGTSVPRDFVEFPSQLYEHWLTRPEVLKRFARHYRTGEPIPDDLLNKLLAARTFNQGFEKVEFIASADFDMRLHLLEDAADLDIAGFERDTLARLGMPDEIGMRHRPPHFAHVFSGGYAAGYYSYLWSEVLDADGFAAFEETGDVFDEDLARRLRDHVYAAGNLREPMAAYQAFRGRAPEVDALLRKRGFA